MYIYTYNCVYIYIYIYLYIYTYTLIPHVHIFYLWVHTHTHSFSEQVWAWIHVSISLPIRLHIYICTHFPPVLLYRPHVDQTLYSLRILHVLFMYDSCIMYVSCIWYWFMIEPFKGTLIQRMPAEFKLQNAQSCCPIIRRLLKNVGLLL